MLDNTVKSFVEIYKQWIKESITIFNIILTHKKVDKDKVIKIVLDIIDKVNKNRNNALMLFGKKFEGVFYVFPQTIETVILSYFIGESLNLSRIALTNLAIADSFS